MVRRGQQRRRALKRAAAAAEHELESESGRYRPPRREDCDAHSWHEIADDAGTIRIAYRIWRRNGRLVDFALTVELSDWSAWAPIARIDCCWGFCHVHPPERAKEHLPIYRLDTVDDMETAYVHAVDEAAKIARTIRITGRESDV